MIKKTLIAFMLITTFSVISCSSDDNSSQVNPYDKFQGEWSGRYSGDGDGEWSATIDNSGKASGTISSDSGNFTFDIKGQVTESGELSAEYYSDGNTVGTMAGTINETTGSGTWTIPSMGVQGTWTGTKN